MKPWQHILTGVLIGLLAAGAILLISRPKIGTPIILSPAPSPTITSLPVPTRTTTPLIAQIGGEVNNPGVYSISKDGRLSDLILLAGGLTSKADESRINYALLIRDGDYFYIPVVDEKIPETARNSPVNLDFNNSLVLNYPINLNEASQEALESLPGIGPTKAADILAYRETFGGFSSVDDLLNIAGIGPATIETIKEYVIVEP